MSYRVGRRRLGPVARPGTNSRPGGASVGAASRGTKAPDDGRRTALCTAGRRPPRASSILAASPPAQREDKIMTVRTCGDCSTGRTGGVCTCRPKRPTN